MSIEQNKQIVRRFIHEGIIGGDLAVIDELCSPECVNHAATAAARHGVEGIKRVVAFSRAGQPDQRWTNERLIAEGDSVVIHGIHEATWEAESFRGVATRRGSVSPWSLSTSSALPTARS